MKDIKNDKQRQIKDIVSVVKLASLLFVGIILFRSFSNNEIKDFWDVRSFGAYTFLFSPLIIIGIIYCIWSFSVNESKNYGKICKIEAVIFMSLFTIILLVCGVDQYQCKLLFLFIIITTTIQLGMKSGLTVSIVSSLIILSLDMLLLSDLEINSCFQDDLVLAGVFILTAWPLGFYVKIEHDHIKYLERMINIDGLTELYNHRYFCDALSERVKIGKRDNTPVSMIFIDIDNFKQYNDTYGHQKGDYVLSKIGRIIKENARKQDIPSRYGGEEFSIILPDTSEEEALSIAEGLRSKIESEHFEGEENQPNGKITASIGVSIYPDKAKNDVELIKSADDALYRAKFFYKNRVEAYTSILDEIKSNIDEKDVELVTSIKTLISVINAKDKYTYGHIERVVMYSRMMADKLKLSENERNILIYGAYMHDIGKINISKDILVKKMKLTDEEWEILKQHSADGVEIIKSVESLKMIKPLILSHHERYDGRGYPDQLKGEEIPYLARILTVVDSFDAMTSSRPYNNKMTYEEGLAEVRRCSGTQFDPEIARAFIEVINENLKNKKLENYK